MTDKFKIGDAVLLVRNNAGVTKGFSGVVSDIYSSHSISVKGLNAADGKPVTLYLDPDACELYSPPKETTMDQTELQVGDYVKRITDSFGKFKPGDIGVVRGANNGDMRVAKIVNGVEEACEDRGYSRSCFVKIPAPDTVQPRAFKIGDTVTNTVQSMRIAKGAVGKIIEFDPIDNSLHIKRANNCSCWLFVKDCVLAAPAKEAQTASNTPVWDIGTLLKSTGSSFGGGINQLGYVHKYDPKDNTYRLRRYEDPDRYFWVRAHACVQAEQKDIPSTSTPTTKKGNTMALKFETRHYINGNNVNDFSPSELVYTIAQEEAEIAKLKDVKSLPKRVKAEIDKREKNIRALVDFLDAQDDAATAAVTPPAG